MLKKPLVLTNGQIEQLQSTDTITSVEAISLTNGEASVAIVCGMAVYVSGNDTVKRAKADAVGTTPVFGLAVDASTAAAAAGGFYTDGILALTTGQWDAVAGTTGGLTAGTRYYLSGATAGNITSTAPATGFVQEIGVALSTTELKIGIRPVIKL